MEALRHSGVRIEELCELTHLSVRQYRRPGGEVVALLVIAPSKTDRERVIPMSAELFHSIAAIIRRHTRNRRTIPLVSRWDPYDKTWSTRLPFLFQRKHGSTPGVMSPASITHRLRQRCAELADRHSEFRGVRFTPHDFRRLFATNLVNHGLPIHIGAALLGHLNLQTTRGYVAVFNDDLIRHYARFLEERRLRRPAEEYRPATEAEWVEFEEHFASARSNSAPAADRMALHANTSTHVIRCPMLHVDPKMLARLDELEGDLLARRDRAQAEGWLGELEGLDLTLSFLRQKREQAQRKRGPEILLGLPTRRSKVQGRPCAP